MKQQQTFLNFVRICSCLNQESHSVKLARGRYRPSEGYAPRGAVLDGFNGL